MKIVLKKYRFSAGSFEVSCQDLDYRTYIIMESLTAKMPEGAEALCFADIMALIIRTKGAEELANKTNREIKILLLLKLARENGIHTTLRRS